MGPTDSNDQIENATAPPVGAPEWGGEGQDSKSVTFSDSIHCKYKKLRDFGNDSRKKQRH